MFSEFVYYTPSDSVDRKVVLCVRVLADVMAILCLCYPFFVSVYCSYASITPSIIRILEKVLKDNGIGTFTFIDVS